MNAELQAHLREQRSDKARSIRAKKARIGGVAVGQIKELCERTPDVDGAIGLNLGAITDHNDVDFMEQWLSRHPDALATAINGNHILSAVLAGLGISEVVATDNFRYDASLEPPAYVIDAELMHSL